MQNAKTSTGMLVNLISNDVARFEEFSVVSDVYIQITSLFSRCLFCYNTMLIIYCTSCLCASCITISLGLLVSTSYKY